MFFRTPDSRFASLPDFPFAPHYLEIPDGVDGGGTIRMHYLDEGPSDAPVVLMVHGMPTWSFLYRHMIPPLVAAGFRCIAPDHIGFGKSDKVLDEDWYSIAHHQANLGELVRGLDLKRVTLASQDWGGPIGLRQAVVMPNRFERLLIMNTWLHHPAFVYTESIRGWQTMWKPGGMLLTAQACGFVMQNFLNRFAAGRTDQLTPEQIFAAYEAPFPDVASKAGPRRFPLSIPIDFAPTDGDAQGLGNAATQTADFSAFHSWQKPAHFIWGTKDLVFTESWGREWAATFPNATFTPIENAGHFLQETDGAKVAQILLEKINSEPHHAPF